MTDAMTDRVLHPSYPSFSGKKKRKNLFSGKAITADSLIGFSVNIHFSKADRLRGKSSGARVSDSCRRTFGAWCAENQRRIAGSPRETQ
jgi:hypothetical protein